jgi:hypothetical protein
LWLRGFHVRSGTRLASRKQPFNHGDRSDPDIPNTKIKSLHQRR